MVEATEDNMLKITNDGRKLALDQRLISDLLPDDEYSKVSACVENVYNLWEQNKDKRLTQLVFSDLSTPHYDGSFNVYDDTNRITSYNVCYTKLLRCICIVDKRNLIFRYTHFN